MWFTAHSQFVILSAAKNLFFQHELTALLQDDRQRLVIRLDRDA